MKLRLSILLLAAVALAATPAAGQTIKSLGYNTTNGVVPTSLATNSLRFTNAEGLQFNKLTTPNMILQTNGTITFYGTNGGFEFSAGATAAQFRDDLGLGATNYPTFLGLELGGGDEMQIDGTSIDSISFGGQFNFEERQLFQNGATVFGWDTNSFTVYPPATFNTNVTVNGSLSVGSLTTTTPSTWALDATQTAAATNGVLTLPSNANVIRLTNNNSISSVTNGVLGAFYYLVNQATNAVTISNVGGITIDGAQNLTLSPNESATLVATGPTNVSVVNRGDLTDVALGGTANTAPSQTASSGSSLMTRNLYDERLPLTFGLADQAQADFGTVTLANGASGSKAAGGFEVTTGTSNNATAVWNASSQATFGRKHTAGIGGVSTVWTGRVMVGWWLVRALSTNSEIRLQYGRAFNATTHAALSARGVGVRIATNSVFFETHDGTTGFETTNAVTATNPMFYWAIVEAGVAKFYAGTALVATVTNNVPTNNSFGNDFGWVMSISNTSTNSSIMRVLGNPGFVMQQ